MHRLKELFDSVLAETKFDVGKTEVLPSGTSTTYSRNPDEIISPDELRDIASRDRWDDELAIQARGAKPIVPDEVFNQFLATLHNMLGSYIDTQKNEIGHTFPVASSSQEKMTIEANGVVNNAYVSPVNAFAEALARSSAITGSERMAKLLSYWIEEKLVKYQTSAILNGIYLNDALNPLPGIRIEPLSRSTDGLTGYRPILSGKSIKDYLGRTVLNIESTVSPAFFHPHREDGNSPVLANFSSNIGPATVCQALTLESGNFVEVAAQWNDYYEASLYLSPGSRSSHSTHRGGMDSREPGFSLHTDFTTNVTTLSIEKENISRLSEDRLGKIMTAIAEYEDAMIKIAISRWCKSKETFRTLIDQFVDLRIAMEALYLKEFKGEQNQEMRFRLALFGAWFLGSNFQDRKKIRKTLRDAYDVASGAVHGGKLEFSEKNRNLLSEGQELCRRGILKILEVGPPDDWGDMILGSDVSCGGKY